MQPILQLTKVQQIFKTRKLKKILQGILKYLIPLLCGVWLFWFVYKSLDVDAILDILKTDVNYFWVILSMVVAVFSHIARAYRWRLQLRALDINPSMRVLINSIFGMYAMNLLFPRLGEVWRCGYVAQRENSSFSKVLGSMVSDRLTDTVMIGLLTVMVFFIQMPMFRRFLSDYPEVEQSIMGVLTSVWLYVALLIGAVVLILFFRSNSQIKIVLKTKSLMKNMWAGFASIITMRGKFQFLFYTVFIWFCYFMQLYLCIFAFPYTSGLSVSAALLLYILGGISMGLPVQGGFGPWHVAVMAGLSYYGIVGNEAGAFTFVAHESQMLLVVLIGIYAFISIACEKNKPKSMKDIIKDVSEEEHR